jgi:lipoate-protein ligase A
VSGWQIERHSGSAREFHGREIEMVSARTVWVFEPQAMALALGSTQSIDDVDMLAADRLDVDVMHRRSGGGAVLIDPGSTLWIDVVIPTDDPLWTNDVSVAPVWLGRVWAAAIGRVGRDGAIVHEAAMRSTHRSGVVCFDGIGPGEVLVGAKTVGISQRRTRTCARFQTIALLGWNWQLHRELLSPGLERVGGASEPVAVSALLGVEPDFLLEAFLAELDQV